MGYIKKITGNYVLDLNKGNDYLQNAEYEIASKMGIEMYRKGHYTVSREENMDFANDLVTITLQAFTMDREAYLEAIKIIKTLETDDCRTVRLKELFSQ